MKINRISLANELSIDGPEFLHNLSQGELFNAALFGDRGRTRVNGTYDERKAYPTSLKKNGPIVFLTDPECTGRPVDDTYAVAWPEVESEIWWKDSLQKYDPCQYEQLLRRVVEHVNRKGGHLYVQDVIIGQDPAYSVPYRFVGEYATHAMFANNMFLPGTDESGEDKNSKRWTMLNIQSFRCEPERDGCRSGKVAIIDFRNRICLVAGRADYCGLVKKLMFTVMNFLLPKQGYLSMHCSANIGDAGDTAILFGLSGTGKTTLSADPSRKLIGDDEAGWTHDGISNLENGCYAKLINLDKEAEPIIAGCLSKPGTIIENVPLPAGVTYELTHPQELDLYDNSRTENTRFSYSLDCISNVAEGAKGGHPETIVLLTADAFGVLPPISVLNVDEVMYYFVQGFTSRVPGTEVGIIAPESTFSSCFGAPFMSQKPQVYANLLKEKMIRSKSRCVLLNTGWIGGSAGEAPRVSIDATRKLLSNAMSGILHETNNGIEFEKHPVFKLRFPRNCPDVDENILNPRNSWKDVQAYDRAAKRLRRMFRENFKNNNFSDYGIREVV